MAAGNTVVELESFVVGGGDAEFAPVVEIQGGDLSTG